ncbi:MAG: cytochrome c oxidase cbb3-type subunit 3 [Verrucomicrobiales bacterium]|jgi:cytochrome c oxidase cbb3-type subunit 3
MPDTNQKLEPGEIRLRDHVYDGIQEYDQKLPNWWLWTFYIAIIIFVIYWFLYYQAGMFRTDGQRIDGEMARIATVKAERLEKMMGEIDDDVLWEMSANSKMTGEGGKLFATNCKSCHAPDLGGSSSGPMYTGLPLNDAEWKYGGTPMAVLGTVMNGSPDKTKGMPAWGGTLGPSNVAKIVSFVMSHHDKPAAVETPPAPAVE